MYNTTTNGALQHESSGNKCLDLFSVIGNLRNCSRTDILERFELSNGKPYLKYIILDVNNMSIDRKIMASYKIDHTDFPAFYLYNEKTGDAKKFIFEKKNDRCKIFMRSGNINYKGYTLYGYKRT